MYRENETEELKKVNIDLPAPVQTIISTLEQGGFEACIVGGCVRDALLGRTPEDWDITTSAAPAQVKQLFRATVDSGIEHGTVTVILRDENSEACGYEVTTYRIDGAYKDGRHPEKVVFTPSLEEDLKRRDFTINAMAYSQKNGLTDLFGGTGDLEKGIVRCVGNPDARFDEDALRIMRAVRFSAQLGFEIQEATKKSAASHASALERISRERIYTELNKTLCSAVPEKADYFRTLGFEPYIAEFFEKTEPEIFGKLRAAGVVFETEKQERRYFRYALICLNMTGTEVRRMFRSLKADNGTADKTSLLVQTFRDGIPEERSQIKKLAGRMGRTMFRELTELALLAAGLTSEQKDEARKIMEIRRVFEEAEEAGEPMCTADLAVNGQDLIAAGVQAGPEVGYMLSRLLELVLKEPQMNTKEQLLEEAFKRPSIS